MTVRVSEPHIGRKRAAARPRRLVTRAGLAMALLAACATAGTPSPASGPTGEDWVDRTLEALTLRERVGQLVMVWMSGGYASRGSEEQLRIEGLVEEQGIGGVVISLGTPHSYVSRLNRLQAIAEVPLLVAADFEAGPGFRVAGIYALPSGMDMGGATRFPPAMAFGAVDDVDVVFEAGRITGLEARALGVHLNFAPVLDVNNNPKNPIINTRSYGENPDRVAELGAAYVRGARSAGLMTTAKHFPGHGDTETDSHYELPVIPGDRSRLDEIELVPFRRAIEAGVDAVMTAHVAAPGILGEDAPPATFSRYFMTELLREELGFDGVLFTDALDMAAIVEDYGPGEAAVRALEAGADVLLMPADPALAIEGVMAAVVSGRLSEARIERSARRLLRMKADAGLDGGRFVDPLLVTEVVGAGDHTAFADMVARKSLVLVRDLDGSFPVDTISTRRVLSITYAGDGDVVAGRVFDSRLGEAVEVTRARLRPDSPPKEYRAAVLRASEADMVVLSVHATPSPPEEDSGPHPLDDLVNAIALAGTPAMLVSFASPYLLETVRDPATYLVAWGAAPAAQRAAADAVLGRVEVVGRLPISLPPLHRVGEGLRRSGPRADSAAGRGRDVEVAPGEVGMDAVALGRVDRIIARAIADSVMPGAALVVGRHGRIVRQRGYGHLDWGAGSASVTDSSLYDLASLTKVIATTTAVMTLVDRGRVSLDDPVGRYLDEWSEGWRADVTLRDLMLHRGGLPPFRPFWRELEGRAQYRDAIAMLAQEYEIGSRTVYSDIGMITLQFVIEEVAGSTLDAFAEETIFGPLGMVSTGFNPPRRAWPSVAPTELDTVFRNRHLRGEVHDENAFALGGVAGHAGLFSNARDLARFGAWISAAARTGRGFDSGGDDAPDGLPSAATVADFTRRADETSSRATGWDTPSGRSSAGRFFGVGSFGHTGFTGTSIWVDPERDVFVVLLTNRVNPTRAMRGHIPLRRAVHDAVAIAIRDVPVELRDRP
ncbi:MAG: glycoside hydrolase family 3 N-terminal domain-containing protein [Gemmatimonadota bacterium]